MKLLLLGNIGGTEILLIVLLGGRKIPELMRGIGKGVKSFRDGMEGKTEPEDDKKEEDK